MTGLAAANLLGNIRQLVGPRSDGRTDRELLHGFLANREESAFTLLFQRHAPLVWGVCRRALRHEQDAEDAFQAAFLILAKKAASIRNTETVGSWLQGVARRTAMNAKRGQARRLRHEQRAKPRPVEAPDQAATLHEMQALLDEEVSRLPAKYRTPFILCFLQGRSRTEAARELGWKEGTVSSRLAQARERLRQRLARRGITLSAALTAGALANQSATAALAQQTFKAALSVATGVAPSQVAAPAVVALMRAGLNVMSVARLRIGVALLLSLSVSAITSGFLTSSGGDEPKPNSQTPALADKPETRGPMTDRHGDPLPANAIARLGTVRFRHGSTVTGLAFGPDGTFLVSGSYDTTLRVWDAASGMELRRIPTDGGSIYGISLSKDGKTVACVNMDSIYLGNTANGQLTKLGLPRTEWQSSVALSPDGKLLAAGAANGALRLWDMTAGKVILQFDGHKSKVTRVVFSPDGKYLASGGNDNSVRFWEVVTGTELLKLDGKRAIGALAISPNGKMLAAGAQDGKLRLWELPVGKPLAALGESSLAVESIAFSPDGKTVVAGVAGCATLWDLATSKRLRRLYGGCEGLAFSPDGATLAMGGSDCAIRLWEVATGEERTMVESGQASPVRKVAMARNGTIAATYGDRIINLWQVATGRELRRLRADNPWIGTMALSADGKIVASETGLWETATGKVVGRFPQMEMSIEAAAFSPDGRKLALATRDIPNDKRIRLFDTTSAKEIGRFGDHSVHALDFSPNGKTLAAGNQDGSISLWDAASKTESGRITGHRREVMSVAFAPDGKSLASSSFDGDIFLWDIATAKQIRQLNGPDRAGRNVIAITYAPNGKMLATAEQPFHNRACITLWEASTGRVRLELKGHQGDVNSLAFAADSRTLVSGSTDTTALVWDVMKREKDEAPAILSDVELAKLWTELGSGDAIAAYNAICRLARVPRQVVSLVQQHVHAVPVADLTHIANWLRDLDRDQFALRENASRELAQLGELAEPALRNALDESPSAEAKRRLEQLLAKTANLGTSGESLRTARAIETLEHIATPEARQLLAKLADGAPTAWQTREAKAALERLQRPNSDRRIR